MGFSASAPPIDPSVAKREQELQKEKEKKDRMLEETRIKNMRGRSGALSLFSDASQPGTTSKGILG